MRLAPLAIHLANERDISKRLDLEREYTSLTHRHPRSIVASYIYLEIIHDLLNGCSLRSSLDNLPNRLTQALQGRFDELKELPYFEAMFQPDFATTLRKEIKSSGYVVDTLLASTWSVLNSTSIDGAVILAVNLGEDTDTIASITATLASCENLSDHINDDWKSQLQNKPLLDKFIKPFAKKEASEK